MRHTIIASLVGGTAVALAPWAGPALAAAPAPSAPAAPAACAPAAPVIGTATPGARHGRVTATAAWSAPTAVSDPSSCAETSTPALTGYVVTAKKVNRAGRVVNTKTFAAKPDASSLVMKLRGRGNSWKFSVAATNSFGASASSADSNKVVAR